MWRGDGATPTETIALRPSDGLRADPQQTASIVDDSDPSFGGDRDDLHAPIGIDIAEGDR